MMCLRCRGQGWLRRGDKFGMCICHLARMMREVMGREIWDAPTFRCSELTRKTNHNVLIVGKWAHVVSHIQVALWGMGTTFRPGLVTDEELRRAFFKGDKTDALHQLVGANINLVIARVGVASAKNDSLPDIFLEMLKIREAKKLPIWVVVETGLSADLRIYSKDLKTHLAEYETVKLGTGELVPNPVNAYLKSLESE